MTCFKHSMLLCSLVLIWLLPASVHAQFPQVLSTKILAPVYITLALSSAPTYYQVTLQIPPTGTVTISPYVQNMNYISVDEPSLTFDATNYNIPQRFTISTVVVGTTVLTLTASGTPEYNNERVEVTVVVVPPMVVCVQESTGASPFIIQGNGNPTYISFYLNARPSSDVAVSFPIPAFIPMSIDPPTLTFTSDNYYIPQTCEIRFDSYSSYMLTALAEQQDGGAEFHDAYGTVFVLGVPARIVLPTTRTYAYVPLNPINYYFPVSLSAPPSAVTTLSVNSDFIGVLPFNTLTFTPDNWNIPQMCQIQVLRGGVATLAFIADNGAGQYPLATMTINTVLPSVRVLSKSIWVNTNNGESEGKTYVVLSAEPTSDVSCTADPASLGNVASVKKDVLLRGWEENDFARALYGWGTKADPDISPELVFGPGMVDGSTMVTVTCLQIDGSREFEGVTDTVYITFGDHNENIYYSDMYMHSVLFTTAPATVDDFDYLKSVTPVSATPTCEPNTDSIALVASISFGAPSLGDLFKIYESPIQVGYGTCQVVSTDTGYGNTPSYYSVTVVEPQIFADKTIYCTSGAIQCAISFTFSYCNSRDVTVIITADNPMITDKSFSQQVVFATNDVTALTNYAFVDGLSTGQTQVTVSFHGGEFDDMSFVTTVIVTNPAVFVSPLLYATYMYTATPTIFLAGQSTPGMTFSVTCTSLSPDVAFTFSTTFADMQVSNTVPISLSEQGIVQFRCVVEHYEPAMGLYYEYNDIRFEFWVLYEDTQPRTSEIDVSPLINFGGTKGTTSVGTVVLSNDRGSNGPVTLTLSVDDPTVATIDTTQMTFTPDNWWNLQTFTVTSVNFGVTRVVVSGSGINSNTITLVNLPPPIQANVVVTQPSCFGTLGSVSVTPTAGSGNYEYHWSPSINAPSTSSTASQLAPGTYYVEITDGQALQPFHKDFTIDAVPAAITGEWTTHKDVTCNGGADGQLVVTAHGGSGTYTYEWTGTSPGSSASTAPGLVAGTYSVKIHDSKNCPVFSVAETTITQPTLIVLTTEQTDVLCQGDSTGSANVSVSGGVGPYTYSWLAPLSSTDDHVSGLTARSYTVEVKDHSQCTKQATVTITEPALPLSVFVTNTPVTCGGDASGKIELTVSGGTTDYSYSWIPAVSQTDTASNLLAGDYKYTVTDAHKCSSSQTITVHQPDPLVAAPSHTDVVCNGASTGMVGVTVTGGNGSPTYAWNPSTLGSGSSAINLPAGIYLSTVTDPKGCKVVQNITISQPDVFSLQANFTPIKCHGGYTNLNANPVGGTAPFDFSWYPAGGKNYTSTLVPAGIYRITASESCSSTFTQSVIVPNPTPLSLVPTQINVACNGDDSGSATVYASGGTPGYTYEWAPSGGNAETATGLRAGTYNVTVTDANGCQSVETYIITEPPPVSFTFTTTPVKCYGATTGSASISVQGGGKRYLYEWNPDVSIGPTASNLLAGKYEVTVTDSKFCSSTQDIVITQPGAPLTISASQKNSLCYGGTGSAKAIVSGGTPGYTYSWSPSGGDAATAIDLQPGTYVLTVTDANGCKITQSYTITQPAPLVVAASQRNVTCQGTSSGVATAKVSGGTPSYNYSWTGTSATSATATGLASGEYSLTVIDAHKCNVSYTYTIMEPNSVAPLSVNLTGKEDNVCKGSHSGALQVTALGGVEGNYSYKWSTGETTNAIANLTAGAYRLVVMDLAGCTKQYSFNVSEPDIQFCQNNATCVAAETCICQNFWNGTDCSIPVCPNGCLHNGTCTGPNQCTCAEGFTGISCQKASSASSFAIERNSNMMAMIVVLVLFAIYM